MKQKGFLILVLGIGLALALGLVAGLALARDQASTDSETIPTVVSYQGEVLVDGQPYNGTGYFKFAVVNTPGTYTYWSNDGTSSGGSEPTSAEALSVEDGLFAVLLGNSAAPYNMPPMTASVFADKGRRLHVWFDADGVGSFTDLGLTVVAAVPYALNAETLDGQDGSYYDQHYAHVIVVAKSGGDYTTVGAALASITDNSALSRYLVWVAPGVYTETVTMKQYVDIEGAGELLTTLSYSGSDAVDTGTVVGADNAELRFLTVRNTGGDSIAIPIYNYFASPRLTHVTVSASASLDSSFGVHNYGSSPAMLNVTASASGNTSNYAVYNEDFSAPRMTDVTASASGGINAYGVYNSGWSTATMTSVNAFASGGNSNYGVFNAFASPTMVDVTASASGGINSTGVYNYSSAPTMERVIASGLGGTTSTGVRNFESSPTIRNSTLSAGNSGSRVGLYNSASADAYIVTVDNCQITGGTHSIYNDDGSNNYTTEVGASLLDGPVTGTGTEVCIFSYDENYTALNSSCQ
jgi:hypothetical protein